MKELAWVKLAREFIGQREVKGERHNPIIIEWLDDMGRFAGESRAWWRDDETPWCGLFVGWVLGQSGRYVVKEWYRAKEWASIDLSRLARPAYGCLAVLDRRGGGHVGFVIGKDAAGNIMLLGGNQGDMVQVSAFAPDRITSYHWPSMFTDGKLTKSVPYGERFDLPLLTSTGQPVTLT